MLGRRRGGRVVSPAPVRALLLVFLILGWPSAARLDAQTYPAYRSYLGVGFPAAPSAGGLVIQQVFANSPAAAAGIKPGDVLLAIDGRPVATPAQARELLALHPPYDNIKLEMTRAGERLAIEAKTTGRVRLEALTPHKVFFIPGVDTGSPFKPADPTVTLDAMNVLTRILVDPASGRVEFIGYYDPAYDTGPIPYRQLLETTIRNPEPAFSLDPDVETFKRSQEIAALQDADFGRMFGPGGSSQYAGVWFRKWVDLILGHPLLEIDRQLFLDKMAAEVGLTKPDLVNLLNYVNMGGISRPVPPAIFDTQVRLLEHEGYVQGAPAYRLYQEGTADSLARAVDTLGLAEEWKRVLGEPDMVGATGARRLDVLQAFVALRIGRNLNTLNDQQTASSFAQFRQGKATLDTLDTWLQQCITPDRYADGRLVIHRVLSGLPLSNELLAYFYGVSAPQSVLRFDRFPGDSALGRILYEADYVLKTIDMSEEIFHAIPGHRSMRDIVRAAQSSKTTPVRWTLVPQDVSLIVSPGRREVGFGPARIELEARSYRREAGGPETEEELAATQKAADLYRAQVNDGYEKYAREYAPLHRLREAAKVLAFARWMNQERIALAPGSSSAVAEGWGSGSHAWTPPSRVVGLYHVYMWMAEWTSPEGKHGMRFVMPTSYSGGVNFAPKKKWVSLSPPPPTYERATTSLTTSAAIGQAAVSAAIGGDLETARSLAEKSAQAMQGRLNLSSLPKVPMPKAPSMGTLTPEAARLVKDAAQIVQSMAGSGTGGGRSQAPDPAQQALLADLGRELNKAIAGGPVASDFLKMLQTRKVGQPAPAPPPASPPSRAGTLEGPAPAPVCGRYAADLATGGDLSAKQRAFYDARLAQIRENLEKVQRAMENIGRLNQQDLAELQKWEREVSAAYEEAQSRVMDAVGLLLVDGPLEVLQKRQAEMREAVDSGLLTSLLARKAAVTADEAAAFDAQAIDWLKVKYRYETIYGQAARLEKRLGEAKATYDLDQWSGADKSDFAKMKDGMMQLTEMALGDPALGGALKIGRITGENLLRWLSLYKAVAIGAGFFGDIVAQKLAWGPVMAELEQSLDQHRQALDRLRRRAADLRLQIQCLEAQGVK